MTIDVFISYSHEDRRLRKKFDAHLAQLKNDRVIRALHDGQIMAGQPWEQAISTYLARADVILLMISAHFLDSFYCYEKELTQAIARHEAGEARVVPVIVSPCDWHSAPFSKLKALPKDAKPITTWNRRDAGWTDVVRGIRAAIQDLTGELPKAAITTGDGASSHKVGSSAPLFEMTKAGEIAPYTPPIDWSDGESWEGYYTRLGFKGRAAGCIGNEDMDHLIWHERSDGEGHKYLATWGDVYGFQIIFVSDWPTLVKLQALAAPIIQAANVEYRLSELQRMAEKAFRAWHDHDPSGVCTHCDPYEAKRLREARAKRARQNPDEGSS